MRVSVIIPYVNESTYIGDCLDSLQEQTCQDFEAVVVCDHSCEEAMGSLREKVKAVDLPVTIWELTGRTGVAAARNEGVARSRGEYVIFLDADDYLERTAIEKMLDCAGDGVDMIRAGIRETWYGRSVYYDNGAKLDAQNKRSDAGDREVMDLTVLGFMLRREFLLERGYLFDESFRYYTDLTYVAALSGCGERCREIRDILYLKRKHNDPVRMPSLSQIADDRNKRLEVLRAYRKMKELLSGEEESRVDGKFIRYYVNTILPWYITAEPEEAKEVHQEAAPCLAMLGAEALGAVSFGTRRRIRQGIRGRLSGIIREIRCRSEIRALAKALTSRAACKKYLYRRLFTKLEQRADMVVFESFLGRNYSDSPRYIYEYLSKNLPGRYRCIWILNEKKKLPYPAKCIKRYSFQYFYYVARARYFVFNSRQSRDFIKREGSVFLQTWHGTPLKKLAFDTEEVMASSPLSKQDVYKHAREWDYLIAPNQFSSKIFRGCFLYDGTMLETGYPRNDILHLEGNESLLLAGTIRSRLGIPRDKKVILYAPTWRDDEFYAPAKHKFSLKLDLERMKREIGEEYVLLLRTHYYVVDRIDLSGLDGFAYNVSGYDDIAELYLISDLLITDYSSVFFDYANLMRPILFFTYDLEKYRDVLRGFYIDMERELPGPLLFSTEEILDAIRELPQISESYQERYKTFYDKYCGWEDGSASQRVVEAVFDCG